MDATTHIRLYDPERDLPALTVLINAIAGSALTAEQVNEQYTWPGHNPARDRFVAARGDHLVGFGGLYPQSARRYFVRVNVHPEYRRQGIGRALLEQLTAEASQRGVEQAVASVEASNTAALAFTRACGFQDAGEERVFVAPADLTLPALELPEGYKLRSVAEIGDLQVFVDACNRCYTDMFGHSENVEPLTVERVEGWQKRNPRSLIEEGMFVLFAPDGSPVGVTRADQQGEGDGAVRVIDAPGVAPEYRHLGLQRQLVEAAAGWHKTHWSGRYQIETWGDSPEAAKIYLALGFTEDEANHGYEFVRYL